MWWTLVPAFGLPAAGCLIWRRAHRAQVYRRLAEDRGKVLQRHPVAVDFAVTPASLKETFAAERITRVDRVLSDAVLQAALGECEAARHLIKRSFVPLHKKGGTIGYESVHRSLPTCLSIYHSPELREFLSGMIGHSVSPTADHDQSSCSVLFYTEAGDHIGWHYDHNFYRGRHFTVLIPLVNRDRNREGVSQSLLKRQRPGQEDEIYNTAANSLIVFEGARVRHCATELGDGELRIMLSMTYSTDPQIPWTRAFARRVKDTAFFGLRALWD